MMRCTIYGNLVLITAINAAYTCVKFGEAICALIIERANNPFPRSIFSFNSSTTTFWMLEMLTLLIMPLILFRNNYHINF
jgi:hypothetical protein